MDLAQLECAPGGAVEEPAVPGGQPAGRRDVAARGCERRAVHAEALVPGELDVGADVRAKGAHAALEQIHGELRVEQAVLGPDLVRVGGAGLGLLVERRLEVKRLDEELAAERGEALRQRSVVVIRADRLRALDRDGACVELGGGLHDGHAGLLVAGLDRALDRGRAAPAWQERRVHVQHTVGGQKRFPDERAVGADEYGLRLRGGDPLTRRIVVHVLRLKDLDAEQARGLGDGRRRDLAAAASRRIGPRDHELRPVRTGRELVEDGRGEVRGAEVDGPHQGAAITTWRTRGPCTPSTRSSSMSEVADGPATKVSGRPALTAPSSTPTASGTRPAT